MAPAGEEEEDTSRPHPDVGIEEPLAQSMHFLEHAAHFRFAADLEAH